MTAPNQPPRRLLVIIGAGGIGLAIARRLLSPSRHLLLADSSPESLSSASHHLTSLGHGSSFTTYQCDISSYPSVSEFASKVVSFSQQSQSSHLPPPLPLDAIIHTAGISPIQASNSLSRLLAVDLLGTANVMEAFWRAGSEDEYDGNQGGIKLIGPGTSFICLASAAAHLYPWPTSESLQRHLATSPPETLLSHPELTQTLTAFQEPGGGGDFAAYGFAKQGNILRVKAAATKWGKERGARINSVSPGVVTTRMSREENESETAGPKVKALVGMSAAGKEGTPDDVAGVVAFLVDGGPGAGFITGADFLVDGGQVASVSSAKWAAAAAAAAGVDDDEAGKDKAE